MPKKRSLEHPECCIRCTSACGRFRVWLHFTSRDDCLQTVRTLDTGRRLPLVAICTAWRADQVLYGSCTIGIFNDDAVLCVFTARLSLLAAKRDRGIPHSTVALLSFVCCCECFSNAYTQIRLRFDSKSGLEQARPGVSCTRDCT